MTTVVSLSSYDYAAGPWALRLTGQASSLGALSERVVLRRLRFHLWLWEDGSGAALGDVLREVAEAASTEVEPSPDPPSQNTAMFEWAGRGEDLADLTQLVQDYVQRYLECPDLTPSQGTNQGGITLAPVGLTRHRLTVANLTMAVNLSWLQLADLAAVLAQAEQAVDVLPEAVAASPRRRPRPRLPLWAGSVAAVLVAAVLGGQWLQQAPPTMMPMPTAETLPHGDELAAGADSASVQADPSDEAALSEPEPFAAGDSIQGSGSTAEGISAGNPSTSMPEGHGEVVTPAQPPRSAPLAPDPPAERSPRATGTSPALPSSRPSAVPPPSASAPESPSNAPTGDRLASPPSASMPGNPAAPSPSPARQAAQSDPPPESSAAPAPGPMGATALEPGSEALAHGSNADGVEAVRVLLQQRWQPIAGLASPLRYRLTLGPMGEVIAWEPLTAPARQYLPQGTLPQVGEVLPNVPWAGPVALEVNLLPSGEVQVLILDAAQP